MLAKPRFSTVPTAYFQPRGIQLPAVSGRGQLVCPGHPQRYGDNGYVIDAAGHKVSLPRRSSDAALLPYHVERSILFVLDRIAVGEAELHLLLPICGVCVCGRSLLSGRYGTTPLPPAFLEVSTMILSVPSNSRSMVSRYMRWRVTSGAFLYWS
jgi:3-deoxy-D-manno-octulosonic-acid transferase